MFINSFLEINTNKLGIKFIEFKNKNILHFDLEYWFILYKSGFCQSIKYQLTIL